MKQAISIEKLLVGIQFKMDKKIANLYDTGNVDKAIHLLIEKINKHPQDIENY